MANISKIKLPSGTTYDIKVANPLNLANSRSFDGSSEMTLLTNDLTPAISKTYESTSYYSSTND